VRLNKLLPKFDFIKQLADRLQVLWYARGNIGFRQKSHKLFKSFTFQLTLLYMTLFGMSIIALLMFIYFTTLKEVRNQIENTITVQISELTTSLKKRGIKRAVADIRELIEQDTENMSLYLLIDKQGEIIAGNMEAWPEDMNEQEKWNNFNLEQSGQEDDIEVLARTHVFANNYKLLVGYKLKHLYKIRTVIIKVLLVSLGLSFIIAALCSTLIMRIISRRLSTVNQACTRVIHGNIKDRVHRSGSDDAFDHLAENFNSMLSWINDLIDGIRDVSNNIAHDLRSPLNRLRNRLENILIHQPDQEQTLHQIQSAIAEIDSLMATFNALLKISQAEAGAGIEQFSLLNLSELTSDVIDFYTPLAEEKEIELSSYIDDDIFINGEKHLISQAFANIIDNAIKYTPAAGTVLIHLSLIHGHAEFSVSDNGTGIPPAYYARVKERFFRLDNSRTTPGNGLGLSLVNAVIKLHQSEIIFSENKPSGLIVTIRIPLPPLYTHLIS
jgi:signal transduction histidine kinase